MWRWPTWKLIAIGVGFGVVEIAYFAAKLTKLAGGGWLPMVIAAVTVIVMTTWQLGRRIVTARRRSLERPLRGFVDECVAVS